MAPLLPRPARITGQSPKICRISVARARAPGGARPRPMAIRIDSVEVCTTVSTPASRAASSTLRVPSTLIEVNSRLSRVQRPACAARWKTRRQPCASPEEAIGHLRFPVANRCRQQRPSPDYDGRKADHAARPKREQVTAELAAQPSPSKKTEVTTDKCV